MLPMSQQYTPLPTLDMDIHMVFTTAREKPSTTMAREKLNPTLLHKLLLDKQQEGLSLVSTMAMALVDLDPRQL